MSQGTVHSGFPLAWLPVPRGNYSSQLALWYAPGVILFESHPSVDHGGNGTLVDGWILCQPDKHTKSPLAVWSCFTFVEQVFHGVTLLLNYLSVIFFFRKPYFNLKSLHFDYELGVSLVYNMLLSKIIWQFARVSYIRVLCYWIGGCFQRSVHPYLMVNVQCMGRMDANWSFFTALPGRHHQMAIV